MSCEKIFRVFVCFFFLIELSTGSVAFAQRIDFIESFVLAEDREAELAKLVPGTDDYYFYNALNYQLQEKFDEVDNLIRIWVERVGFTERVHQIMLRQALLTYPQKPRKSLNYLIEKLQIRLNHERLVPPEEQRLKSEFDTASLEAQSLIAKSLANRELTDQVEDVGVFVLTKLFDQLSESQRHHLLQRLVYPDSPKIVERIAADIRSRFATPFGSMTIHQQLTLAQMDELAKLIPDLLENDAFVQLYCRKLRPNDDVEMANDPQAWHAYLSRVWKFLQPLSVSQNSFKAAVLYQLLQAERHLDIPNREHFQAYLNLPRHVHYISPLLVNDRTVPAVVANLSIDFSSVLRVPGIGNDEPLVVDYLHHFLRDANSPQDFAKYFNEEYLNRQFATVKILNNLGDVEKWAAKLPASEYKALIDRVDIDFAPTNPIRFNPSDRVKLGVGLKNVKELLINVFEINAESYYRKFGASIDTSVKLDGLIPNWQQKHTFTAPPALRQRHVFEFPELDRRGVFVIDMIGNGQSSRVLLVKGRLSAFAKTTSAGQLVTVFDESGQKVKNANLWIGQRNFTADKDGFILVPFSSQAENLQAVVNHEGFASLMPFSQMIEQYSLQSAFFVDRETLLRSRIAKVLVRPHLKVNEFPIALKGRLGKLKLTITTVSHDGTVSTKVIEGLEVDEAGELVAEFQVPPRIHKVSFALTAEIQNRSRNVTENLAASREFLINEIDRTDFVQNVHLVLDGEDFALEVRGLTGELRPNQVVYLTFKHELVRNEINATLQTNAQGRILLGKLDGIVSVQAKLASDLHQTWNIQSLEKQSNYRSFSGQAGKPVVVRAPANLLEISRESVGFFELRQGIVSADRFENMKLLDGMLVLEGLDAGDYLLVFKDSNEVFGIRVSGGILAETRLIGRDRSLELREVLPLAIVDLESTETSVKIQLDNAGPSTRVHVMATRFVPRFNAFEMLNNASDLEPAVYSHGTMVNLFLTGRKIGDEYRYVLDRQSLPKYPGNMLTRPSLLLNPWALQDTVNREAILADGEAFSAKQNPNAMPPSRVTGGSTAISTLQDLANLDFLDAGTGIFTNLRPDKDGLITIDKKELKGKQHLTIVAVDVFDTIQQTAALKAVEADTRDLRLAAAINPEDHVSQQKQIELLAANTPFVVEDILSARFRVYDSLESVFRLAQSMGNAGSLEPWRFLLKWNEAKESEKEAWYSEFACHELNFFIWQKDRPFFERVIRPYLKNKFQKTLVDRWLLEEDLRQYFQPHEFKRLNVFEMILLLKRAGEPERANLLRLLRDEFALLPLNQSERDRLFDLAVQSSALNSDDKLAESLASSVDKLKRLSDGPQIGLGAEGGREPASAAGRPTSGSTGNDGVGVDGDAEGVPGKKPGADKAAQRGGFGRRQPGKGARDQADNMPSEAKNKDAKSELSEKLFRYKENLGDRRGLEAEELGLPALFFRQVKATQEWIENNYYRIRPEDSNESLIDMNRFWMEWAEHSNAAPFLSKNFLESCSSLNEVLLVLSILDLPATAPELETEFAEKTLTFKQKSPCIVFHEQIRPAIIDQRNTRVLIGENFFLKNDRYRTEGGLRFDKFIDGKFNTHSLYGGQVVVTNPTSTPQVVELLVQIPEGAVATSLSQETRSIQIALAPFNSFSMEYSFYFPAAGHFKHFPAHVTSANLVLASAAPRSMEVIDTPAPVDRLSWAFISQHGNEGEVLDMLQNSNLFEIDLTKIAFRMRDREFFRATIELLRDRHVFEPTLWSYSLLHDEPQAIKEFLSTTDLANGQAGDYLKSQILAVDFLAYKNLEHHEFWPLVNQRAHPVQGNREITNPQIHSRYHQLLRYLSFRPTFEEKDELAIVYFLILQDRVAEAIQRFERLSSEKATCKLQYDYLDAYLQMYRSQPDEAAKIAEKYISYPVSHWKNRFAEIAAQVAEIRGGKSDLVDDKNDAAAQANLAANAPAFQFKLDGNRVVLDYQNINDVVVNFYLMDAELLFSTNPFASIDQDAFSLIRPNLTKPMSLSADAKQTSFDLPDEMKNRNLLVEIRGQDLVRSLPYYANGMNVQIVENFGQLKVTAADDGRLLPQTYVKVYVQNADGSTSFYKDGYTDLRGRFDYATNSSITLEAATKFSLFIQNEKLGTTIRQANIPQQ
jgi:hypothetical protein